MNKVIMQLWEESEKGWGIRPDGCSLHIDSPERIKYVNSIYEPRKLENDVPNIYERTYGEEIEVFIEDGLFKIISEEKTIRLSENEFNNLFKMQELIIKC